MPHDFIDGILICIFYGLALLCLGVVVAALDCGARAIKAWWIKREGQDRQHNEELIAQWMRN